MERRLSSIWEVLGKLVPWAGWLLLVLDFLTKHPPPVA